MLILNKMKHMIIRPPRFKGLTLPPDKGVATHNFIKGLGRAFFIFSLIFICCCQGGPKKNVKYPKPTLTKSLEERIHFDFDNDQIKSSEIIKLENNIKWLNDNPWAYIVLEGHCDIVGSEDYNIYLGDRRARSVKAYLYEHGIDPERIVMLVSYGKSRPIDLAKGLKANSQNRRVEFVLR